jgi:hypothetical protein
MKINVAMAHFNVGNRGLLKYDIYNPNLDMYLEEFLNTMSQEKRDKIPTELIRKCFKKGKANVSALRFGEAAFIASTVFDIPVYVVFGGKDKDAGIMAEDVLSQARKVYTAKGSITSLAEKIHTLAGFVVGDKNIVESLAMIRLAACTDYYKQVIPVMRRKARMAPARFEEHRTAYRKMVKLMMNYESKKKKIYLDYGFTSAEWYCMLFYFDVDKKGNAFYGETFRFAVAASQDNMRKALTTLTRRGMLTTRGGAKIRTYTLSAKGENAMLEIFEKIVMDY